MAMEASTSGDDSRKKNCGKIPKRIHKAEREKKIPKRVHKAEREKMKRECLNELFLALANSLELSDPNNGKASVLKEATRMVKDMVAQIKCLKKENETLLSESQYVTVEKNELRDEKSVLEAEIGKLQTQINSKVSELQLDLNVGPPEYHNQETALYKSHGPLIFPHGQIVSPLHPAALCSNFEAYPKVGTEHLASMNIPVVSKPHARYPTPSDKWPSQVLENLPELGKGVHHG